MLNLYRICAVTFYLGSSQLVVTKGVTRSLYIRCAVNPKGPCQGCSDFEPRQ
ncbi:DUF6464 family protein [Trichocoleus desertorum]|uniref:DUF6464 family protein n=1 Tax=Trichocoleus desertorum TaxID=1481672 RepID=UPI003D658A02